LLNEAKFLPEIKEKTEEELRKEAETEESEIKERETNLVQKGYEKGCHETREKYLKYLRRKRKGLTIEQIREEIEKEEGEMCREY
jgi:hypothetical protein